MLGGKGIENVGGGETGNNRGIQWRKKAHEEKESQITCSWNEVILNEQQSAVVSKTPADRDACVLYNRVIFL